MFVYFLASLLFGLTSGLSSNLFTANLLAAQAQFGATTNEVLWLSAAFSATNATATLLLWKFRTQYGIRIFAELGLGFFVLVSLLHLFTDDLNAAVVLRGVAGFATAPLGTLAFLYMLEPLPPSQKLSSGLALGLMGTQLSMPLARVISPDLLQLDLWHGLNVLELGLAMLSFAVIYLLPITPPPRAKVFDRVDILSLPLLALGCGLLSVALTLGRYYWWLEAPWLGVTLAGGIGALTLVLLIEMNRAQPLLHLHFLSSLNMIAFGGSMLILRCVMAEQSTGMVGFFQNLGLLNDHMTGLFWVITAATLAGSLAVACINKPHRAEGIHLVALLLIAAGAWMDSQSTSLTRPQDLYLSQAMMGFGAAIFLPAATSWSFTYLIRTGMQYLPSFLAVFLVSQNFGGLLGSAGLGTLLVYREKFHSSEIVQSLTLQNPAVASRIQQYSGVHAGTLGDPALRGAEGNAMLAQVASRESYVLAYNDVFLTVSVMAMAAIVLLLAHMLFKRLRGRETQAA
ncbi:MFS transporter (plasmid) [Roseomonas marmotae]|uniref:MFS transporter n=1 Tax=Roseomonas marmotae TaxID=2768161 RepID=A0ABS3KI14_9PROT|nr:MFS transporter [Roseomonas marmotae]QTI82017.1 MFS transporter [Roseomonas marmotae]